MARKKYDWTESIQVSNLPVSTSSSLLSPTDYYRKRADLIEHVIGQKINIEYSNTGVNYIQRCTDQGTQYYSITIAKPMVKGVPTKTAIYHELSHALHETFLSGVIEYCKDTAKSDSEELVDAVIKDSRIPVFPPMAGTNKWNMSLCKECGADSWTLIDKDYTGRPLTEEEYHIMCDNDSCRNVEYEWIKARTYESLKGEAKRMLTTQYHDTTNVLEDQRIESLTSMIWLATRSMFNKTRHACGKVLISQGDKIDLENPTNMMLGERFYQPQVCTDNRLKDAVHLVEGASKEATVIVFTENTRIPILEWMQKNVCELLSMLLEIDKLGKSLGSVDQTIDKDSIKKSKDMDKVKERLDELRDAQRRHRAGAQGRTSKDLEEEINKLEKSYGDLIENDNKKQLDNKVKAEKISRKKDDLAEMRDKLQRLANNQTNIASWTHEVTTPDETASLELSKVYSMLEDAYHRSPKNTLQDALKDSKSKGLVIVKELQAKFGVGTPSGIPSNVKIMGRTDQKVDIDNNIVTTFARILRKIKERDNNSLVDTGEEVDIDGYINAKTTGNGDCFVGMKKDNGLCMMVTIDGSGSMKHNDNIGKVRTLVSSIFTVAKNNPEIKIVANIWSSNSKGDVGLTEINSLDECSRISLECKNVFGQNSTGYYETPTHIALEYSAKRLGKMKARNKMLIMITDGLPQYSKDHIRMQDKIIVKNCKKALKKSLEVCPNILAINIEKRTYPDGVLRSIFGKRFITFSGMAGASVFIQTQLRRKLIEVFRN